MAKGIILGGGPTGGSGRQAGTLIISDYDLASRSVYKAGDSIEFTAPSNVNDGYFVEGTVTGTGASRTFTVTSIINSTPVIITGSQAGGATIGSNQVYYITSGAALNGNINVNGGRLLVTGGSASGNISIGSNSSILSMAGSNIGGGTFNITGGGSNAVVALQGSNVNGMFSSNGLTFLNLGGNTFNGNLTSDNDRDVIIKDNNVGNSGPGGGKNLTVTNVVVTCDVSGNTVYGSTTLGPNCQP